MASKLCAVIPSHNHYRVLGDIVATLRACGLSVFIVDDGSDEPAQSAIAALHQPAQGIIVQRLAPRRGKGSAVIAGLRMAAQAGFTQALQIDADGQHDLAAVPQLAAAAEAHPDALILGTPRYDSSAPRGRIVGRWVTHLWVCIETLSTRVIDTMCGFRVYPLAATLALAAEEPLGHGMEFDTEVAVRLLWRGVPVITVPVGVFYPHDNHSNFRMLADNMRISWMHTRLVTRLLLAPFWPRGAKDRRAWYRLAERGAYWGLQSLALIYRLAGERACTAATAPIALWFHVTGREQRRASRQFLALAFAAQGRPRQPSEIDLLRHTLSFSRNAVESFGAWALPGKGRAVDSPDRAEIERVFAARRGIVLIVSHLGNIDISRAVLRPEERNRISVLLHTRHSQNFARLLQRWRPDVFANTFQVDETNPGTIIDLRARVEAGSWIAIAGDRVPVNGGDRVSPARFLGRPALFPQGAYILAHLLECPVYLLFCMRDGGRYSVRFERFADRIDLPRRERESALGEWIERYARRLEAYTLGDPFQWYNFYDFWAAAPADVIAQ